MDVTDLFFLEISRRKGEHPLWWCGTVGEGTGLPPNKKVFLVIPLKIPFFYFLVPGFTLILLLIKKTQKKKKKTLILRVDNFFRLEKVVAHS